MFEKLHVCNLYLYFNNFIYEYKFQKLTCNRSFRVLFFSKLLVIFKKFDIRFYELKRSMKFKYAFKLCISAYFYKNSN